MNAIERKNQSLLNLRKFMKSFSSLIMKKCCFIGLGYIGLPSALLFAESGFEVLGVDIKEEVIKNLNSGRSHINEPFIEKMLKDSINQKKLIVTNKPTFADAFFITVPTQLLI